jgi:outer membrane protein OmpA-like peptidoglycan-associated protein
MKRINMLMMIIISFLLVSNSYSQFNILEKVKKKVVKKAERETDKTIDKGVDKGFEEAEKGITGEGKDAVEKEEKKPAAETPAETKSNTEVAADEEMPGIQVWSKYDFIPGDRIIFEDNLIKEQPGEFPSKWDLLAGNVENAKLGDQNVISFVNSGSEITPWMNSENYLPEVFTVELDIYFYGKYNEEYSIDFGSRQVINIRNNKVNLNKFEGVPGEGAAAPGWHHIAVSFNKRALKCYYDQTRVLNIPRLKTKPVSFKISALSHGAKKGEPAIIKDIRIAEGGVELYDRIKTDGKFVTRGILFDVNKAIIKPESMGVINEIKKLLMEHQDISFSIEGHTDSDGDEAANQNLSERRARTVKNKLVSLGISSERLAAKGIGESKPIEPNDTPVGKANNRRVEFVVN